MYSIFNAVTDAYNNSSSRELKAEIYLTMYQRNDESREYLKILKRTCRNNNKLKALADREDKEEDIEELTADIERDNKRREELINEAENNPQIHDCELVAERLLERCRRGLIIIDLIMGFHSEHSSYGRLVYHTFKGMSRDSLIDHVSHLVGKNDPGYFQQLIDSQPEIKEEAFLDSEKGALFWESQFMTYLIGLVTQSLSEDEVRQLLDDIVQEIAQGDMELFDQLTEVYKGASAVKNFYTILAQMYRLSSLGKNAVLGTSTTKINNMILNTIIKRGAMRVKSVVVKKYLTRLLISGPLAVIINILLLVPDVAKIVNKRDYFGLTVSILLLNVMRSFD